MSSNQSIPLEVIYNRLESTGIPAYSHTTYDEETPSSFSTSTPVKTMKKKKTSCCAKFLVCCWCMFLLTIFTMTVASLFMAYSSYKGCFHSKNYELTEMITAAEYVSQINFDVVTGAVIFNTHDETDIVVKFYRSARDEDIIEGIISTLELNEGVLSISSYSPAFDYDTCQYSYIEILFPQDYATNQVNPISITGSVKAGFVEMSELSNLGDVIINVDLGTVEMGLLNANSIEVQGGLVYLDAEVIYAEQEAKFAVETGSLRTSYVMTPQFEAITGYGSSRNSDIQSDDINVHSNYGYATLLRPSHFSAGVNQKVDVHAFYGKALATYDLAYDVDFSVTGAYGDIAVMFEDECSLVEEESTEDLLVGGCKADNELFELESTSSISVSVTYGNSVFLREEFDEEDLNEYSYPELSQESVEDLKVEAF